MRTEEVQDLLARHGLPWTAAESEISRLPIEEKRTRLGAHPPPGERTLEERERHAAAPHRAAAAAAPPPAKDWRSVGGQHYVTPVRNQGACNACVAFASIAAFETTAQIARKNPQPPVDLSEADLWFCWGPAHGAGSCPNGLWWPTLALDGCVAGIVDDACFPYTDAGSACQRCPSAEGRLTKATAWHALANSSEMKQWLANQGPVIAIMTTYEDFYHYTHGVYSPLRDPKNVAMGGHCVCIVGYDDADAAWICKNSWGTAWGENGFFRIAYGACGIDADGWCIDGVEA